MIVVPSSHAALAMMRWKPGGSSIVRTPPVESGPLFSTKKLYANLEPTLPVEGARTASARSALAAARLSAAVPLARRLETNRTTTR